MKPGPMPVMAKIWPVLKNTLTGATLRKFHNSFKAKHLLFLEWEMRQVVFPILLSFSNL